MPAQTLTNKQMCQILQISPSTFEPSLKTGVIPEAIRIDRIRRWSLFTVAQILKSMSQQLIHTLGITSVFNTFTFNFTFFQRGIT